MWWQLCPPFSRCPVGWLTGILIHLTAQEGWKVNDSFDLHDFGCPMLTKAWGIMSATCREDAWNCFQWDTPIIVDAESMWFIPCLGLPLKPLCPMGQIDNFVFSIAWKNSQFRDRKCHSFPNSFPHHSISNQCSENIKSADKKYECNQFYSPRVGYIRCYICSIVVQTPFLNLET